MNGRHTESYVAGLVQEFPVDQTPFEARLAAERIRDDDVLRLLDHETFFDLLGLPRLTGVEAVLTALDQDRLIRRCDAGGWDITNLGALLLARRLRDFGPLGRKTMRVVRYRDTGRLSALREFESEQGYAVGFHRLVERIGDHLPSHEAIVGAFRETRPAFPQAAVREAVANALIHQDFHVTGAGPMVEIFDGRIEVSNPGEPLVDTDRFLDTSPKSRNESVASLMRRFAICERPIAGPVPRVRSVPARAACGAPPPTQGHTDLAWNKRHGRKLPLAFDPWKERGTGIDKLVDAVEHQHLPPPLFEIPPGSTRVVLFSHRDLRDVDSRMRIRAVYQHACLRYVQRDFLTNTSLRERFGIEANNRAWVSRLIKAATEVGVIAPFDTDAGPKAMRYVPWWAVEGRG